MLQSESDSTGKAEDEKPKLDAQKKRWRQMLQSAQQMGLEPDAMFLDAATKTGTNVAKATGISTSVSILLLFLSLWNAAKRGCAHILLQQESHYQNSTASNVTPFFLTT